MPDAIVLRGGSALSEFRRRRLLAALQAADDAVADVRAWHLHVVLSPQPLTPDTRSRVAALLDDGLPSPAEPDGATVLWVMPRLGTVSPWSSKATDIAQVCGLAPVRRIERGIEYRLQHGAALVPADLAALAEKMNHLREVCVCVCVQLMSVIALVECRLDGLPHQPSECDRVRLRWPPSSAL
jgi:phosphoribosylformylglycinamidine synthase